MPIQLGIVSKRVNAHIVHVFLNNFGWVRLGALDLYNMNKRRPGTDPYGTEQTM